MQQCEYDANGYNKQWLTSISVDERSLLKKFFQSSGPQFTHIKDYWVEEFCGKLKTMILAPGVVVKHRNKDPDRLYILISGKVSVSGPMWNSSEMILVNDYYPG